MCSWELLSYLQHTAFENSAASVQGSVQTQHRILQYRKYPRCHSWYFGTLLRTGICGFGQNPDQTSPVQLSSAQLRSEEPVLGVNFTATRTSLSNLPDARLKNISASVAEVARSVVFLFPPCCKLINILFIFLSRFFPPHENKFWLLAAFKTKQTSVMEF